MLIFISGGVRSGKSSVAEQLTVAGNVQADRCLYIATSRITDNEMKERIRNHQVARETAALSWITYERPTDVGSLIHKCERDDVVLLDCLTNWLANELFSEGMNWESKREQNQLVEEMIDSVLRLRDHVTKLVIVSNDLFEAGVTDGATYIYMKLLGTLHQRIVAKSDIALSVEAGVVSYKKGKGLFT
ncbi:bifunctional adenosylcobinamide kinase/adenosylcobinamide-phosphate guanylyltransferase [Metabacillus iocasae]|uniref:Adenosylcobinamide kinase n=1 Tax=Priestia iocasae TaxID=2291674 RepID=A0ABS2QRB5_9BACI|nr:bifunctional adenosylcobinamide kinase/adenosylcobinamide-phosphate guanylyltransferase [Metabacillus iocasae]MBM7701991.1 adenosylcobinamide kinase/adenosylcobinamide-phosphate guanylyltransferase [Metabacillus iocasae]